MNNLPIGSTSNAVILRDGSCRITKHTEECDAAHLCPKSEEAWFMDNDMEQYGRQKRMTDLAINDASNLLLLRADLHRQFDKSQFVFLPKNGGTLVTHVLKNSEEARLLYHNTALHPTDVAPEFLLARFAWAIFSLVAGFLRKNQSRLLLLNSENSEREASAEECYNFSVSASGRSRSISPQKPASPAKRTRLERDGRDMLETQHLRTIKRLKSKMQECSENLNDGHSQRTQMPNTPPVSVSARSYNGQVAQPLSPFPISQPASPKGSNLSVECYDELTLKEMKEQMLLKERERSDPKSTWSKEQDWLDWILDNGGALDAKEIPRFMAALGKDIAPEASDLDPYE
ncbi:MAG: hypothetical protein Q9191_000250 [Dirinaria sp. TL-2023a]